MRVRYCATLAWETVTLWGAVREEREVSSQTVVPYCHNIRYPFQEVVTFDELGALRHVVLTCDSGCSIANSSPQICRTIA